MKHLYKILVVLAFLHVIGASIFQLIDQTDLATLHLTWAIFTYLVAMGTKHE